MEILDRLSILVICDNMGTLRFFEKLLGTQWNVIHAESRDIGLEILQHTKIDMIVLHDEISEKSEEVCAEIRKLPGYRSTPLFLITGNLKRSYMKQMVSAGVTDFLVEPLDENEFRKNLEIEKKKTDTEQKMNAIAGHIPLSTAIASKPIHVTGLGSKPAERPKTHDTMLLLHVLNYRVVAENFGKPFEKEFKIRLGESLRPQDSVMKKGSGKFLILLPKTSTKGAELIASMLQETLSKELILPGVGHCALQVSIQVVKEDTIIPGDDEEPFNISKMIGKRG